MAIGDLASVRVHTDTYPLFNENAWGFVALTGSSTWRTSLGNEFVATVLPLLMVGLVETCELRNVLVVDEVPGTAATISVSTSGITTGSVVDDPVPPTVSALLSWVTEQRGRSGRGRTYIPALPRGQLRPDGYLWDAAAGDYLSDLLDVILATYGPTGSSSLARLVVISRQLDLVAQVPPVGYPVVNGEFSSVIASQRRRLLR